MTSLTKFRSIFWGAVFFVALFARTSRSADIKDVKFYEIESGRITYSISGVQVGTETVVWKDYGRRSMRKVESQIEFMGVKQENRQTTITDGIWIYTLDLDNNSATKVENPILKGLLEKGDGNMLKTGEDMMRGMGGKVVGKDTVLKKSCTLWRNEQMMNMTACIWKGLPLMTKGGTPGMEVVQTATALSIGKVRDEEVSLPAGMKIVEGEDPMAALRKMQGNRSPEGGGMSNFKGMPGGSSEGQDPAKMMEEMKKMQERIQEEMKQRGMGTK